MVDEESMNKAVELVFAQARKMHKLFPHIDEEEFSQEGMLHVLTYAEKFSPYGAQFSTYVFPEIQRRMYDLARQSNVVLVSKLDVSRGIRAFRELDETVADSAFEGTPSETFMEDMYSEHSAREIANQLHEFLTPTAEELVYRVCAGESFAEIGADMGLSKTTVSRYYTKAIESIRKRFDVEALCA